jgi:hypothetical protein
LLNSDYFAIFGMTSHLYSSVTISTGAAMASINAQSVQPGGTVWMAF